MLNWKDYALIVVRLVDKWVVDRETMTPTVSVLMVIIGFTLLILVGAMVPQSSARVPRGRGRGSKWW